MEHVPEPIYLEFFFYFKLCHSKSSKYNVRLQKMPKIHIFWALTYKIFPSGIQNMGSQKRSHRCGHSDTKKR